MPGGRPPKTDKRPHVVNFRLTAEEHDALIARCRTYNITVSEYLRALIGSVESPAEISLSEYLDWCRDTSNHMSPIVLKPFAYDEKGTA